MCVAVGTEHQVQSCQDRSRVLSLASVGATLLLESISLVLIALYFLIMD